MLNGQQHILASACSKMSCSGGYGVQYLFHVSCFLTFFICTAVNDNAALSASQNSYVILKSVSFGQFPMFW